MARMWRSEVIWLGVAFVSFIAWMVPSAWLVTGVIDFAWSGFNERLSGDIGSRALIVSCGWVILVAVAFRASCATTIGALKFFGFMWLVVLAGASLIALESWATRFEYFQKEFVAIATTGLALLSEVLLSVFIVKKLFNICFVDGKVIGYLRALTLGFTGLAATKLALFILMPGAHIRVSPPLLG